MPTRNKSYTNIPRLTSIHDFASFMAMRNTVHTPPRISLGAVEWYKRRGIIIECVQTDNGSEFTTRFIQGLKDKPTLFQSAAAKLGIRHKLIRPYTPRHNGKVERSHREDHNKFYSCHSFYSCDDLNKQLKVYLARSNNRPMRPLNFLSPVEFLSNFRV